MAGAQDRFTPKGMDPIATRRMLVAASVLRIFGIPEIAAHAGVSEALVKAFAAARPDLIEALAEPRHGVGPGARRRTHRLAAEQCTPVATWLAQTPEVQTGGDDMSKAPTLLGMLEATVAELVEGRIAGAAREGELAIAGRQFLGASASLRHRREVGAHVDDNEEPRLRAARRTLDRLAGGAVLPPVHRGMGAVAWASSDFVLSPLFDWMEALVAPSIATVWQPPGTAGYSPESLLDEVSETIGQPSKAWEQAARLLMLTPILGPARLLDIAPHLAKQLATATAREPSQWAALAISAAMLDSEVAAEPLFAAVLHARATGAQSPEHRHLCCAALARLAQPWHGITSPRRAAAASACFYLARNRGGLAEADILALAPAALSAAGSETHVLLDTIAAALAAVTGSPALAITAAEARRAAIGNLALALRVVQFEPLDQHLPTLLKSAVGEKLIAALASPATGALEFEDRDGEWPFGVRDGVRMEARLFGKPRTQRPPFTPLSLGSQGKPGRVFASIIETARRERPPSEVARRTRQRTHPAAAEARA